ncbi:TatD family hydrolase [Marinobacter sp. 1Y8]
MFVDAHCHLDFPEFDGTRDAVLAHCRELGVGRLVMTGVRAVDWPRLQRVSAERQSLFYCLGIHPWFVAEHDQSSLEALELAIAGRSAQCVGLGECGLDRLRGTFDQQLPWFEAQVDIAGRQQVPLVIHSVRANDEVAGILRQRQFSQASLVHGFSGSEQQARKLHDLGCYLGVGGVITYERAKKTRRALAAAPLSSLVLETDAPDMPPTGIAAGENSPEYIPMIFRALCDLRPEPEEVVRASLLKNACALYGWPSC